MPTTMAFLNEVSLPVCAVALALASPAASFAQSRQTPPEPGIVSGVVREAVTGNPVATARVSVEGTQIGTLSRRDGRFVLQGVPAGDYALVATSIGYEAGRSERVRVLPGGTTVVDLTLNVIAISIEVIVVTPGRFGVMHENAGA